MRITGNTLVKIPRSDWCKLRDLYGNQRISSSGFSLLQCLVDWVQKNSKLDIEIFALNGDWEHDGTFVAKAFTNHQNQIYCNTLNENLERLIAALNCLDPNKKYFVAGFPQRILPAIEQYFSDSGIQLADMKPDTTVWYHIPREEVENFEVVIPTGVTLRSLESSHADYINSNWPHRAPDSLHFVEHLIGYNESVGAFDENGELMAYCLLQPFGSLGLLQVKEKYRRRALAQLVVRYMAKKISSKNIEVVASVIPTNVASRSLFEKLGFRAVDQAHWVFKPPTNAS